MLNVRRVLPVSYIEIFGDARRVASKFQQSISSGYTKLLASFALRMLGDLSSSTVVIRLRLDL